MCLVMSLLGVLVLLALAWMLSTNRRAIAWRTVLGALFLQALIGGWVLAMPSGIATLEAVSAGVGLVLAYSREGIEFMFGWSANGAMGSLAASVEAKGFAPIFAVNVLPVIVIFSALVSVLYHLGIMGWTIRLLGGALQRVLGTSRPESLSAAANVFVGQAEAPLVARPFIPTMTASELFAIMVGGLASIAGSVMAGYAAMGIELKYLIAACFMAAPGGLLMAKMVMPETEQPKNDLAELDDLESMKSVNLFDAAASGALSGMHIALAVGAMLVAFIALMAMVNGLLGALGGLFGYPELTLELILGWVFQPLAWLLGVPWGEAEAAGSFIGQKLVLNEFVAYLSFTEQRAAFAPLTQAIITFALCGFANFSSIAILLGGLGSVAPNRREDIARFGFRALLAATLANLMSAALAGFYLSL
ncbi:MAG: NupC/NupG family nucleoside CNT transporter [Gammaproteobacteria bacterium]|nr:NupC/NupG family nucleoside CNT transporter [Gammaproteobacteria bacterium]